MLSDAELLRCYVDAKSEAAFAELVTRRIDLVYSVAIRQCGGDAHLAQDVVQRVFADLARKARSLSERPVLTGWLYRSARFAATDLVRAETRRRTREEKARLMHELHDESARDADWERFRPTLDEAISELAETDRDAVMLRFFEQQPFREIGAKLRLSEDAARMRVDRALDRLRVLLANRGVVSTAAAVAMGLANQAGISAPVGLASSITGGALAASGGAAAAAGSIKSTVVVATLLAVAAVGTAVYEFRAPPEREEAQPIAATKHISPPPAAAAPMAEPPAPLTAPAVAAAVEQRPSPFPREPPTVRPVSAPLPPPSPTYSSVPAPIQPVRAFVAGSGTTELEDRMDDINTAFRKLNRQINEPAKNDDSLRQVQIIRTNAQAALGLQPRKKMLLPEADQPKFIADYQEAMRAFLADVRKLEAAIQAGDNKAAQGMLERLKSDQAGGHKTFKKEKKK